MKKVLLLLVLLVFAVKTYAQDDAGLYQEKTFQTTSGKTFSLATISGDAIFTTGSSNEVRVKIYANSNARRSMEFKFEENDNGISLNEEAKDKNMNDVRTRYEITVPENYNISSASASGDMVIKNVTGTVKISTASGDIVLNDVNGETKVASASGDILLTGRNGKISASTASGDINVDLTGENNGTKLSSASGDIEFSYSSGFSADVSVSSLSGSIDVPSSISRTGKDHKNSLKGTINGGGNDLKCSTVSGSVTVREK